MCGLSVHFFVRFEPLPGKEAEFREELLRVVEPIRAEVGCLAPTRDQNRSLSCNAFEHFDQYGYPTHHRVAAVAPFDLHGRGPTEESKIAGPMHPPTYFSSTEVPLQLRQTANLHVAGSSSTMAHPRSIPIGPLGVTAMHDLLFEIRVSTAGESKRIVATGIRPSGGSPHFSGEELPAELRDRFTEYLDANPSLTDGTWKTDIGDKTYYVSILSAK